MTKHKSHEHEPEKGPHPESHPDAEPLAGAKPRSDAEPSPNVKPRPVVAPDAKLQAELQAAKDRELRCLAELENYRKRAARELDDKLRYANMSLLRDLLPVVDNIERAIEAAEKNADAGALLDGFKMVQQQIEDVLKKHHCERIEALHAPFDPNVHHAVMQQSSAEHPANTVLMVTQNGYQLHDRVVRPSQVIVSKAE